MSVLIISVPVTTSGNYEVTEGVDFCFLFAMKQGFAACDGYWHYAVDEAEFNKIFKKAKAAFIPDPVRYAFEALLIDGKAKRKDFKRKEDNNV